MKILVALKAQIIDVAEDGTETVVREWDVTNIQPCKECPHVKPCEVCPNGSWLVSRGDATSESANIASCHGYERCKPAGDYLLGQLKQIDDLAKAAAKYIRESTLIGIKSAFGTSMTPTVNTITEQHTYSEAS